MKITVLTGADDNYWKLMQLVAPNRLEYCMKHGYQLSLIRYRDLERHFNTTSIAFIERDTRTLKALRECNWLFYMDVDSIITNMKIRLEDIINEYFDCQFIIGNISNGINNGIMLIRNCPQTINFLTTVIEDLHTYNNNQGAMADILKRIAGVKVARIKQTIFNSMPYDEYNKSDWRNQKDGQWEKGHFVMHVPALRLKTRIKIIKEHLEEVTR